MGQHHFSVWLLEAAGLNQCRHCTWVCQGLSAVDHKPSRFINSPRNPGGRLFISAHLAEVEAKVLDTEFIAGEDFIYHLLQHLQFTDKESGL